MNQLHLQQFKKLLWIFSAAVLIAIMFGMIMFFRPPKAPVQTKSFTPLPSKAEKKNTAAKLVPKEKPFLLLPAKD